MAKKVTPKSEPVIEKPIEDVQVKETPIIENTEEIIDKPIVEEQVQDTPIDEPIVEEQVQDTPIDEPIVEEQKNTINEHIMNKIIELEKRLQYRWTANRRKKWQQEIEELKKQL